MGYWLEKVVPNFRKVFAKSAVKKAAAAEVAKAFEEAKEANTKEFEEKKAELEPKVLEIYEASPPEIKALIKEPKDTGLKKNSAEVQKFLTKLSEIEFPGAKTVAEAATKLGPVYLSGPISSIFGQISPFLPVEEKPAVEAPAPVEASTATVTEKEIVVEAPAAEEKKEETPAPETVAEPEKTAEPVAAPAAEPAPATAPAATEPAPAAAPAAAEPPKP